MKNKPMTVEEMSERWSELPPFDARRIHIESGLSIRSIDINQDTIKEIREYLEAVENCMNE